MSQLPAYIRNAPAYRLLATPPRLRKSARGIAIAFGVIAAILIFSPWQQTAPGDGRVVAWAPGDRVQQIAANVEGRVEKWFVREGDRVKEGEPIAKMADNDPHIMDRLGSEREAIEKQIDALRLHVRITGKNLARQKALLQEGVASEWSYEQAQIAKATADRELANAEARLLQLDSRIARQGTLEIRAPKDGVVQSILVGENVGLVKSADVLAILVPSVEQRVAELFLDGRDLPFVREGQLVRLQFEGWPIIQFAGLPDLSVGTFVGRVMRIDSSDAGGGKFRILVEKRDVDLWPSSELLRQGVRARGWVQLNRVPLWFEAWRLINGLPPFAVPLGEKPPKKP